MFDQLDQNGSICFEEVQFYFLAQVNGRNTALTMLSMYDQPDATLLEKSHNTAWVCKYCGTNLLKVVHIEQIMSMVTMISVPTSIGSLATDGCHYFMMEKVGLEVAWLGGVVEQIAKE